MKYSTLITQGVALEDLTIEINNSKPIGMPLASLFGGGRVNETLMNKAETAVADILDTLEAYSHTGIILADTKTGYEIMTSLRNNQSLLATPSLNKTQVVACLQEFSKSVSDLLREKSKTPTRDPAVQQFNS